MRLFLSLSNFLYFFLLDCNRGLTDNFLFEFFKQISLFLVFLSIFTVRRSLFLIFFDGCFFLPVISLVGSSLISSDISPDLNPLYLAFMDGRIEITDFYFSLESIAFDSSPRPFPTLITYINSLMNDLLLFSGSLFFRGLLPHFYLSGL